MVQARGALLGAVLAVLMASSAADMYPDDHWSYSTKLTTSNYQAPSWNNIVKEFAGNTDVSFGDINLQTDSIVDNYNPGMGGWPTIRYFNKETGYEGAHYTQKTEGAVCDELKQRKFMKAYVEEKGSTLLCNVATKEACADAEKEYIDKWTSRGQEERTVELEKLKKKKNAMKRIALLSRIITNMQPKDEL